MSSQSAAFASSLASFYLQHFFSQKCKGEVKVTEEVDCIAPVGKAEVEGQEEMGHPQSYIKC